MKVIRETLLTNAQIKGKTFPKIPCSACGELKVPDRPPTREEYDECITFCGFFPEETSSVICDDCFEGKNPDKTKGNFPSWFSSLDTSTRDYYKDVSIQEEVDALVKKLRSTNNKKEGTE